MKPADKEMRRRLNALLLEVAPSIVEHVTAAYEAALAEAQSTVRTEGERLAKSLCDLCQHGVVQTIGHGEKAVSPAESSGGGGWAHWPVKRGMGYGCEASAIHELLFVLSQQGAVPALPTSTKATQ